MSASKTNSWDPVWEKVFSENPWGKYPGESLIRFVARNFYNSHRPDVKLLEVGCGPGANIWSMAKERFSAYGIDGSVTAIDQAKKRLSDENLSAELSVGDIIYLPYPDDFFEAVIDSECIYANNLQNSHKILDEVKRVLKPGGLFYSRSLSDKVYLGRESTKVGEKEFTNISDGPLAGRGFARLMDINEIETIYGSKFEIISIDELEITQNNREQRIREFIIICRK